MGGQIVQLVQGEKLKLAFNDFEYWIERFSKYPIVQLIDLDAAMRQGENRSLIEMICKRLPCQVGGGLKTAEDGRTLLKAGAKRVIYGSSLFGAAEPGENRRHKLIRLEFAEDLKKTLGEEALVFSVDTKAGKVAVKGWKDSVDLTPEEAITWLEDYCAAFLYTHVDTEGTMQGFPLDVAAILRACTAKQLIVAGGIKERSEIDSLDAMGVDAVAGMAVYSGAMEA
jgi:phosphoribosylformimino-5-aminoimidazole carboxamide ribotide isomerase